MSQPITYHSHPDHRQDQWVIHEVFKGRRNGYFVEAGAGGSSNTLTLETQFGWTGLAVEPHPERFETIKAVRTCILENVCLTDVRTEVEFVLNHFAPGTSGIQGLVGASIREQAYKPGGMRETIRVPGYPLWELLRKHRAPQRINYLSLDIEGAEWLAMKDFPFDEYSFECMTIERGSNDYFRLRSLLLRRGYRLVRVGTPDDFWVHPGVAYHTPLRDVLNTAARRLVQPIRSRIRQRRAARREKAQHSG
jgi:hypothetical protein